MEATDRKEVALSDGNIAKVASTGETTVSPFPRETNSRRWKTRGHYIPGTSQAAVAIRGIQNVL